MEGQVRDEMEEGHSLVGKRATRKELRITSGANDNKECPSFSQTALSSNSSTITLQSH